MRLTVLCVCGTLLAISSLSRITAVEGFLLEDQGFGPCIATLRPEGACITGQHESTCPYRFSLPPFTIHLPQQLQELEKIVQDLQKLKDSVDELREMCADCTVSQNECGRQREREHENLNEGKATLEDERNRMKVRHEENDRDLRQECSKVDAKVEKVDGDNDARKRLNLEEKDRKEWETDRRSNRGILKKKEREETLTEVAEKARKTKTEGTRGKDSLEQKKMPTAGANDRITREKVVDENHKETESGRNTDDAEKESSKGYQDYTGRNGREGKMTTDVRNKGESDHHIWRNETKKTKEKTQTEVGHGIKIPENHGEHTNKEQKQHEEEKRKEMKEGIIMDRYDKKPKQTESFRNIEKESTIKEGKLDDGGRETGKEIKTENMQREGDGELSSSKIIEATDFVSISPTLQSTMRLASSPESVDSNKATIFTSSLPSPSLPSSTLSLITDVGHDTRAVYGPTQSTDLGAAGIPKPRSFDAALATTATTTTVGGPRRQITSEATRSNSASTVKPAAGFQGHITPTPTSTTIHEELYITAIPRVTDHSRWTPKKNTSSRTKTPMKALPGQGPKPVKKHKSPIKPEAKQKLNNSKNDRKPDQPLSPDKKTKHNQKQKPSPHKPKTDKHKPGKDSEQIQNVKPDQKPPTDILGSDENLKRKLTLKHNQDYKPDQNNPLVKKTGSQKTPTPVQSPASQRPQTVNITLSDIKAVSDEGLITGQDSKPEKKLVNPLKTDKPSQKQKPEKKMQSEEKTKLHKFELNENPKPVHEPEPKKSGTASLTPKSNREHLTKLVEKTEENALHEPKSKLDSTTQQTITSDRVDATTHQEPKSSQKISTLNQTPEPTQKSEFKRSETATSKPNQKHLILSVEKSEEKTLHEPKSNPDSTPEKKITSDQADAILYQEPKSSQEIQTVDQTPKPGQKPEFKRSETPTPKLNQQPLTESLNKPNENPSQVPKSNEDSGSRHTPAPANTPPYQKPKPSQNIPKNNQAPKPDQVSKPNKKHPKPFISKDLKIKPNTNPKHEETPQTRTSKPGKMPNLKPISVHDKFPKVKVNKTSKPVSHAGYRQPARPTVKPRTKPIQRPKPAMQPKLGLMTETHSDPPHISRTTSHNIHSSHTDMPSTSGLVKQIADVTHSPTKDFSVSLRQAITLGPKTSYSLETGPFPHFHTLPEDFTVSPNSRIMSDLRPQTVSQPPSIPMTTRPNKINHGILQSVITSMSPGSTQSSLAPKSDPSLQENVLNNVGGTAPATQVPSPSSKTTSTLISDLRSATPTTSGPEPPAAEPSTPSARELRVKINQVAAFLNNSLSPNGRAVDMRLKEHPRGNEGGSRPERTDSKIPKTSVPSKERRDCSDHLLRGETKSGVYLVTPDHRSRSFQVFCDMELDGGGWTLLQRRQDGSVSFNRTWAEYQSGFGQLDGGEFWLGNNVIHLLTRDRDMVLRVELEDFGGVTEHAQYELFRVAGERLRYRLTVGGYSGTAGDALRFSKSYDHNNRAFSTPDRDNDRYPSGNCGAYYSSGWWFDACMAANLNGRYYKGSYKGVRDGIFWGTWHNISTEYYPTNERQSFKTVRMMIRPKSFAP